jgi:hypothetical protein
VHDRLVSKEPMYLLFNVAVSNYWHYQDPKNPLVFPAEFKVDYVRVYQVRDRPPRCSQAVKKHEVGAVLQDPDTIAGNQTFTCDPPVRAPLRAPGIFA